MSPFSSWVSMRGLIISVKRIWNKNKQLIIFTFIVFQILVFIISILEIMNKPAMNYDQAISALNEFNCSNLVYFDWKNTRTILYWNDLFEGGYGFMFGKNTNFKLISCPETCLVSVNRCFPEKYDALIFHTRNIHNPPLVRRREQIYIAWTFENPVYQTANGKYYIDGHFYNWSATYSKESTITLPYGTFYKKPARLSAAQLPQMKPKKQKVTPFICFANTHWDNIYGRFFYVEKLREFIPIDIFGYQWIFKGVKRCPSSRARHDFSCHRYMSSFGIYKFYLAFENAPCKEYVTEKPYFPLRWGMVPVVLGGLSTAEYAKVLPPHSFINAADFKSIKHLAGYLKDLNENDEKYMTYHAWRSEYRVHIYNNWDYACKFCQALHNETLLSKQHTFDLRKSWHASLKCDRALFRKLLSGS